jgi:ArsR family transcriptional regulator
MAVAGYSANFSGSGLDFNKRGKREEAPSTVRPYFSLRSSFIENIYRKNTINSKKFPLLCLIVQIRYVMATPKTEAFTQKEQDLAAFAKALAHPARIAIMKILAEQNECVCGRIVEGLPLAQSTVSQHLKELKKAGLIDGTVDGPRSCYCINWKAFEKFNTEFNRLFTRLKVQEAKNCC